MGSRERYGGASRLAGKGQAARDGSCLGAASRGSRAPSRVGTRHGGSGEAGATPRRRPARRSPAPRSLAGSEQLPRARHPRGRPGSCDARGACGCPGGGLRRDRWAPRGGGGRRLHVQRWLHRPGRPCKARSHREARRSGVRAPGDAVGGRRRTGHQRLRAVPLRAQRSSGAGRAIGHRPQCGGRDGAIGGTRGSHP